MPGSAASSEGVRGVVAALAAYIIWGAFPLLFHLLKGVDAGVIVAHRIVWASVFLGAAMSWGRRWRDVRAALTNGKTLRGVALAALLLSVNWLLFIWAVNHDHALQASFGYFINPLVNVALGVVLLKERLDRVQMAVVALALIAVLVQAVGIGHVPWVALVLAFSFGLYGYIRKTLHVGASVGLFMEMVPMLPLALLYLACAPQVFPADRGLAALLVVMGPVTAMVLMLFVYGARRITLTTLGMLQYVSPTLQFLTAICIFHEPMNHAQFFSFVLIWISLAVFTAHSLRRKSVEPIA